MFISSFKVVAFVPARHPPLSLGYGGDEAWLRCPWAECNCCEALDGRLHSRNKIRRDGDGLLWSGRPHIPPHWHCTGSSEIALHLLCTSACPQSEMPGLQPSKIVLRKSGSQSEDHYSSCCSFFVPPSLEEKIYWILSTDLPPIYAVKNLSPSHFLRSKLIN